VITGIHHLKIPVSDLARSRAWYEWVLDFDVQREFPDGDGVVRGVAGAIGGVAVALRENPEVAKGVSGFDPICFAIPDKSAAIAWAARFEELGADFTGPGEGTIGWVVQVRDPDGIEIRLYSTGAEKGLDGKIFRAVSDVEGGEVDAATVFTYHERDGDIWAEYEGGQIKRGHLVGTRDGDRLDFRYSQLNTAGETSTGHCLSTVETLPDGRLRLAETWQWESRPGSGTSVVEEVAPRSKA
jgi:catechol 2,3-dioxygenase-like lactoylglutathione lyase family enzyme